MENLKVKILNNEGNLVEYKVILTFKCKSRNKNYIIYEGYNPQQLFVASYNSDTELNVFNPISAEEFDMVKSVLNTI